MMKVHTDLSGSWGYDVYRTALYITLVFIIMCMRVWYSGVRMCPVPLWIHWSRRGSCFQLPVWLWARCWAVSQGRRCVPCGLTYDSLPRETEDIHLWREGKGWRRYKKEQDEGSHGVVESENAVRGISCDVKCRHVHVNILDYGNRSE